MMLPRGTAANVAGSPAKRAKREAQARAEAERRQREGQPVTVEDILAEMKRAKTKPKKLGENPADWVTVQPSAPAQGQHHGPSAQILPASDPIMTQLRIAGREASHEEVDDLRDRAMRQASEDPLKYLQRVMTDEEQIPGIRVMAAKIILDFTTPKPGKKDKAKEAGITFNVIAPPSRVRPHAPAPTHAREEHAREPS